MNWGALDDPSAACQVWHGDGLGDLVAGEGGYRHRREQDHSHPLEGAALFASLNPVRGHEDTVANQDGVGRRARVLAPASKQARRQAGRQASKQASDRDRQTERQTHKQTDTCASRQPA